MPDSLKGPATAAVVVVVAWAALHALAAVPAQEKEAKMSAKVLEGKSIVMIIARQNFRDEELADPRAVFQEAGAKVTIASSSLQEAVGMLKKVRVKPDLTLDKVDAKAYDAVVFVGGAGASEYWNNKTAHRIATEAQAAGKLVCAICIAPVTLGNAGLLKGKKATCFPSERAQLVKAGANYTGASVEKDGNIITADGPASARRFGETIRDALAAK